MSENEVFPIFAYLRAKERARENNRFCVLKTRGADKVTGHPVAWEDALGYREAGGPKGGELLYNRG